jgi:hypothetical protein
MLVLYKTPSSLLLAACIARCIATVAARTTESTVLVLLAAFVLRAFSSSGVYAPQYPCLVFER